MAKFCLSQERENDFALHLLIQFAMLTYKSKIYHLLSRDSEKIHNIGQSPLCQNFFFYFLKINTHTHRGLWKWDYITRFSGNDLPSPSPSSVSGPPLPYLLLIIFLQSLTAPHTPYLPMYTDIETRVDTIT